jgi:hypothetical protein
MEYDVLFEVSYCTTSTTIIVINGVVVTSRKMRNIDME